MEPPTLVVKPAVLPGLYTLSPAKTNKIADAEESFAFDDSTLKAGSGRPPLSPGSILRGYNPAATATLESPSKRGKPYKGHPTESAFDERSVAFKGYYNESVADSALETWRCRHLFIRFYLGDSTTEVNEVENEFTRNDGIIHGKFLRRCNLPGLDRTNFQSQLKVGSTIDIYGRKVMLYACDDATRGFFESLGVSQPENFEPPVDAFTEKTIKAHKPAEGWYGTRTSSITRFLEASRGSQRDFTDSKARSMKYEGVKLLFHLLWRFEEDGKMQQYKYYMQYYLSTQEVEISEAPGQRNYRTLLLLLKRRRLPRSVMAHDDRPRSCEAFEYEHDYYHEDDLLVGHTINIFGRPMQIVDVDDFTQEWYLAEMGIDQKANAIEVVQEKPVKREIEIPPHLGIGSEEDTLNSLKSLVPKQPRKDFKGRNGYFCKWKATLVSSDPIDKGRDFRITYYQDDKEVSVGEEYVRNSGITAGVFMRRMRLRNPATGEFYKCPDFVVGENIKINSFTFNIYAKDKEGHAGPDATINEDLLPASARASASAESGLASHKRKK